MRNCDTVHLGHEVGGVSAVSGLPYVVRSKLTIVIAMQPHISRGRYTPRHLDIEVGGVSVVSGTTYVVRCKLTIVNQVYRNATE